MDLKKNQFFIVIIVRILPDGTKNKLIKFRSGLHYYHYWVSLFSHSSLQFKYTAGDVVTYILWTGHTSMPHSPGPIVLILHIVLNNVFVW